MRKDVVVKVEAIKIDTKELIREYLQKKQQKAKGGEG